MERERTHMYVRPPRSHLSTLSSHMVSQRLVRRRPGFGKSALVDRGFSKANPDATFDFTAYVVELQAAHS